MCLFNTICAMDQGCGCTQNMLCFTKSLIVRAPFRLGVKLCVTQPECTHNAAPLFLPLSLENVTSEWQYCWMLLLLAAASVRMLSHSFGPSLPCALQQCWSQWIKTFRGKQESFVRSSLPSAFQDWVAEEDSDTQSNIETHQSFFWIPFFLDLNVFC